MAQAESTYQGIPPEKPLPLTVAEYIALDGNYEIHQGELVEMSPNTRRPMDIAGRIYASLLTYVSNRKIGQATFEVAFVLEADDRTNWVQDARQPDVAFVSQERAEEHDKQFGSDGPWRLVPDMVVEVVSPNDVYSEVLEKVAMYLRYGVKIAMIADPKTRTIRVHSENNPGGVQLGDQDTLTAEPIILGWSIPLMDVFGPKA